MQRQEHIVQMITRYPFGVTVNSAPNDPVLVKLSRRFNDKQFEELRKKIEYHSKLRHPSLISISRAFQSQKGKFFDVFFQYIPVNIRSTGSKLSPQNLLRSRDSLLDLCSYLINMNIYPEVAEELIGVDSSGLLRLYLDIDFRVLTASQNKAELIKVKQVEINNIVNQYLRDQPNRDVPKLVTSRSQDYLVRFNYVSPPRSKEEATRVPGGIHSLHNIGSPMASPVSSPLQSPRYEDLRHGIYTQRRSHQPSVDQAAATFGNTFRVSPSRSQITLMQQNASQINSPLNQSCQHFHSEPRSVKISGVSSVSRLFERGSEGEDHRGALFRADPASRSFVGAKPETPIDNVIKAGLEMEAKHVGAGSIKRQVPVSESSSHNNGEEIEKPVEVDRNLTKQIDSNRFIPKQQIRHQAVQPQQTVQVKAVQNKNNLQTGVKIQPQQSKIAAVNPRPQPKTQPQPQSQSIKQEVKKPVPILQTKANNPVSQQKQPKQQHILLEKIKHEEKLLPVSHQPASPKNVQIQQLLQPPAKIPTHDVKSKVQENIKKLSQQTQKVSDLIEQNRKKLHSANQIASAPPAHSPPQVQPKQIPVPPPPPKQPEPATQPTPKPAAPKQPSQASAPQYIPPPPPPPQQAPLKSILKPAHKQPTQPIIINIIASGGNKNHNNPNQFQHQLNLAGNRLADIARQLTQHHSMDTYYAELGQTLQMPKINMTELRQTTQSPPKIQPVQQRNKLHESVGIGTGKMVLLQEKIDMDFMERDSEQAESPYLHQQQHFKKKQRQLNQIPDQAQPRSESRANYDQVKELQQIIDSKFKKFQEEDGPLAQEFNNLFEQQDDAEEEEEVVPQQDDQGAYLQQLDEEEAGDMHEMQMHQEGEDGQEEQYEQQEEQYQEEQQQQQQQYEEQGQEIIHAEQQQQNQQQQEQAQLQQRDLALQLEEQFQSQAHRSRSSSRPGQQRSRFMNQSNSTSQAEGQSRQARSKQINERVIMALKKSEAMLDYFNKYKAANSKKGQSD